MLRAHIAGSPCALICFLFGAPRHPTNNKTVKVSSMCAVCVCRMHVLHHPEGGVARKFGGGGLGGGRGGNGKTSKGAWLISFPNPQWDPHSIYVFYLGNTGRTNGVWTGQLTQTHATGWIIKIEMERIATFGMAMPISCRSARNYRHTV